MDADQLIGIKAKLVGGVVALASRTLILQVISFSSTFILTILLSPEIFGVFFLVSAVISFLSYFSDIGFAAALVQRHEEPSRRDFVTAFTVQQLLVSSLVIIGFLGTRQIASFYAFGEGAQFLLHMLLLSFFFSSLKTIPSILLERKLDFSRLVLPQILETLAFYLVAIGCAYAGMGVFSFGWAAIVRGVVGTIAIFIVSPWRPGIGIHMPSLRSLLSFGVPFQMNSLLALVKDDLLTLVLGKLIPSLQLGYVGWAKKWAEAPLRIIMDNVIRVTFPAFSRLQSDKMLLKKGIERSFFILSFCIFPATVLLLVCISPMVHSIPKYEKWEPAIVSFYFFTLSSLFSAFSSPVVNALNAIGKIKKTLSLMVMWTALSWILIPYGVTLFGYQWVAIGMACISLTSVIPLRLLYHEVQFSFFPMIYKPGISAFIMGVVCLILMSFASSFIEILISIMVSSLVYIALSIVWMKEDLRPYASTITIWRR